jgi:hypothetical protein
VAKQALWESLEGWRDNFFISQQSPRMMTARMFLPDAVINALVENAVSFVTAQVINHSLVGSKMTWGLATKENLTSLAVVISKWRDMADISREVPQSG